ncbi:hypothetical protein RhiirA4_453912 [Rhizophagus irregularis]|uniref:TLDc domain-containing protein n=1 Tax=Rhizophagus irregularis TaxID=588596 RepID=A0A2I1G1L5_9GLOM|nr:hypothetical protein RhiirA4_453912 [Rhizophagus irregularis]
MKEIVIWENIIKWAYSIFSQEHYYKVRHLGKLLPKELEEENCPRKFIHLEILHKDRFGVDDFKLKCNNKGATIVILKLKNTDKIIGGYNPIRWSASNKQIF